MGKNTNMNVGDRVRWSRNMATPHMQADRGTVVRIEERELHDTVLIEWDGYDGTSRTLASSVVPVRKDREDNVKAIFHGGYSYAIGEPETFASVDAVAAELENRYFNRSGRWPVVDSSATFVVFLGDKLDYPDYLVSIDDNGDTNVERV